MSIENVFRNNPVSNDPYQSSVKKNNFFGNKEVSPALNIKEELNLSPAYRSESPVPLFNKVYVSERKSFSPGETLSLVQKILSLEPGNRSGLVNAVNRFSNQIEQMNQTQLVFMARTLGEIMKNTDNQDDLLASLQDVVLEELENRVYENEKMPDYNPPVKQLSEESINWAFEIQEKAEKGYKLSQSEKQLYTRIQKDFSP